jgi:hypothetical protein
MDFFLSAYLRDDSRERPTGGLVVDAPSSEAVEEAGHCEEIVLRENDICKNDR